MRLGSEGNQARRHCRQMRIAGGTAGFDPGEPIARKNAGMQVAVG